MLDSLPGLGIGTLELLLGLCAALLVAAVGLLAALWRARGEPRALLAARLEQVERAGERTERAVREEIAKNREEAVGSARHLREELVSQLLHLTESNEKRLETLREVVDTRLAQVREETGTQLDKLRATVDEKLQGTLEKRLGEAFQQVSERLEAVHKGLGEMQSLANGVGDLKKVLSNVKTRGTWGEIQLGELLDQILTPDQFERNVVVKRGSAERVDFALRLPGRDGSDEEGVWLPLDAKFPQEDYQRLLEAQERGDPAAAEEAGRALEARVKLEARTIRDKYLNPPRTTDFAILFVPTESLYAEVLRRPGLPEKLQALGVVVAGPMNLVAMLNALRVGFRTLAIQKRSSEVWKLLGAVKNQFGEFSGLLDKVQDKLRQASNTIESASKKSRGIERRLRRVEELPEGEARALLPAPADES